ncbi:MAG TPA: right-handed parallel beta-helix repeat-containing protein [bacterium]|nr:right-handed parallel beta-helix repeat-containing protein [bacterium]
MKKFLSFQLAGLLSLVICQEAIAAGPTYVKDAISASTEWTKDNSPYVIQNDIVVSKGAILTIDPGVEVQFAASTSGKVGSGPNLVVEGGLKAVGAGGTPVSFNPASTGSLWGALYFYNADSANCLLQGCLIKGGRVVCNGASPTITQCAIYGAKTGVEIYANSQPQIVNNKITANGYGISLRSETASPVVTNNEVYNNNVGFYFEKFGTPTITANKIYNNLKYNMINYSPMPLNAPNNDFRTMDAQLIARTIYDGNYNASLGRINLGLTSGAGQQTVANTTTPAAQEKPKIQEEDFWSYGRPFDAMKMSNVDNQKKDSSGTVKVLAVGATAVVTAVLLFL